ncbi:unnamed protein product, partial [marine sediment metagenome]
MKLWKSNKLKDLLKNKAMSSDVISRYKKAKQIIESGKDAFVSKYDCKNTVGEVIELYSHLKPGESKQESISICGRIIAIRKHGKLTFADIRDQTGDIQLYLDKKRIGDIYDFFDLLDIGDWISIEG